MLKRSGDPMNHSFRFPANKQQKVEEEEPTPPQQSQGFKNFIGNEWLLDTSEFSDVNVFVGKDKEVFKLHKAILVQNSGYFRRIFKLNGFKEGMDNEIYLPDHDATEFLLILNYLYSSEDTRGLQFPRQDTEPPLKFYAYVILFRDAIYFDIPCLKDAAVDRCVNSLKSKEYHESLEKIGIRANEFTFADAVAIFIEHWPTQARALDPIFRAICDNGFLELILKDEELKYALRQEPELMARLLELKCGLE